MRTMSELPSMLIDKSQIECDPLIERFEPPLRAQEAPANAALADVSVAVKDNFDIAGHVTGGGTPAWRQSHRPAEKTASAVQTVLSAGASVVGKAHMDELAFSLMGVNAHYGTPVNPAAPARAPGGSSSGSAVAVAAGLADVGLGTDTGGSVRIPASFCGLYGLRPTHGMIAVDGLLPLAPSFDVPGLFARDIAMLGNAAAAFGIRQAGMKARFMAPVDVWGFADPATTSHLQATLSRGMEIQTLDASPLAEGLDDIPIAQWRAVFQVIQGYEVWKVFGDWIQLNEPLFGPGVKERFEAASRIDRAAFQLADARRGAILRHVRERIGPDGVLILPTAPGPAPARTASGPDLERYRNAALSMLCIAGLCGLPQLTLPCGHVNGAPVGLSLMAAAGSDGVLLAHARDLAGNGNRVAD